MQFHTPIEVGMSALSFFVSFFSTLSFFFSFLFLAVVYFLHCWLGTNRGVHLQSLARGGRHCMFSWLNRSCAGF